MRTALLFLLVAGCAALKPGPDEAAVVSQIVDAAVEATRVPNAEQRDRLSAAMEQFVLRPDETSRLRVAVLLATLPRPLRDDPKASALLEPLTERQPETPIVRFAALLRAQIAERQRVAEDAERLARAGEQREEMLRRQNEALRASEHREETLRRQVETLRESEQRVEILRRQVEALRQSERGTIGREEKIRDKAR